MKRITGHAAIEMASTNSGVRLAKYADPSDGAREVTIEEAREIASEDPSLIYVTKVVVRTVDASRYEDHDDSLEAARLAVVAEMGCEDWELAAEWADSTRDQIAIVQA